MCLRMSSYENRMHVLCWWRFVILKRIDSSIDAISFQFQHYIPILSNRLYQTSAWNLSRASPCHSRRHLGFCNLHQRLDLHKIMSRWRGWCRDCRRKRYWNLARGCILDWYGLHLAFSMWNIATWWRWSGDNGIAKVVVGAIVIISLDNNRLKRFPNNFTSSKARKLRKGSIGMNNCVRCIRLCQDSVLLWKSRGE